MKTSPRWLKIYLVLGGIALLVLFVISLSHPSDTPTAVANETESTNKGALHAEQTRVYHESAKAAKDWNGHPLTNFEKEELWQLSRTDAAINIEEKKRQSYDPLQEPDH